MVRQLGVGDYQYQADENWNDIVIDGVASDVATDSRDRVYVAVRTSEAFDNYTGVILVLDQNGNFLRSFGDDKLRMPHHIWISDDDEIYLTDYFDHVVRKYSTDGRLLQVIGTPSQPGNPDGGPFNMPTCAVRANISGDVFVSDGYRQNRVHRFSYEGDLKLSWGTGDLNLYDEDTWGSKSKASIGPGEFHCPHSVSVDRYDRVYIMDRGNDRIQVFDDDGNYLNEWATPNPNQAVIDKNDVMHTASGNPRKVFLTNLDGEKIGSWGDEGTEPWQFMGGPHGLWIDSHDDIYVAQVGAVNALNKYKRI
jgi:hypothetical protein